MTIKILKVLIIKLTNEEDGKLPAIQNVKFVEAGVMV